MAWAIIGSSLSCSLLRAWRQCPSSACAAAKLAAKATSGLPPLLPPLLLWPLPLMLPPPALPLLMPKRSPQPPPAGQSAIVTLASATAAAPSTAAQPSGASNVTTQAVQACQPSLLLPQCFLLPSREHRHRARQLLTQHFLTRAVCRSGSSRRLCGRGVCGAL